MFLVVPCLFSSISVKTKQVTMSQKEASMAMASHASSEQVIKKEIHGGAQMMMGESAALSSMQESFSSQSAHMASSSMHQETSFSSSSMASMSSMAAMAAEMQMETMSLSSMSSMASSHAMSSSSMTEMMSHSHLEGSSMRSIAQGMLGKYLIYAYDIQVLQCIIATS